jgi:hypothetical protein
VKAVPERVQPKRSSHQRGEAAVGLRLAGATYSEVAAALGFVNAAKARDAVEKALAAQVDTQAREHQRLIESRRIERLMKGLWGKAMDPANPDQIASVRTLLALIDRHIKLYGLDAPTQVEVYTPAAAELEAWVSQMTTYPMELEEADVVDGEVVDAEVG